MTILKTDKNHNYRLVRACFIAFCDENELTPYINGVMWEHEGFSCSAANEDGDILQYRAVDACCMNCCDSDLDHCPACNRNNQIDFEEV